MLHTRTKIAGAITVVGLAISLTACSGGSAPVVSGGSGSGGTLTVRISSAMQTSDPFREIGTGAWQMLRQVYEGLVSLDNNYDPIPMLAESWKVSDDGKAYSFKLRDGVKFQNGKTLTTADAKYSLDYYRKNAVRASNLKNITSVDVVDDLNFTVKLKVPQPNFLALLGQPIEIPIVPEGSADNDGLLTKPIGTGPFMVYNFEDQARAVLKKFPDYKPVNVPSSFFGGRKEAKVDTVEILSVPEEQTAIAGIQTGLYDITMEVPPQNLDQVKKIKDITVQTVLSTNSEAAYIATASPVVKDVDIRRAILTAIDKQQLTSTTIAGAGTVTNSYVSPAVSWYDKDAATYWPWTGGTEKAKQMLAATGYKGEDLEIIAGGPKTQQTNATLIGQMLTKAGFKVTISKLDHATYQSRLNKGDFQIAATGTPLRTPPDLLYNEYYCAHGAKVGRFGYCNETYDTTFDAAKQTSDETTRNAAFAKLEKQLKDDAVVDPWYFTNAISAVRSNVHGYQVSPSSFLNAWNISVDK